MASRFDTHLDLRTRRDHRAHPTHNPDQTRPGHHELDRTEYTPTGTIGRRQHRRGLADIDGNDDRGRRDWGNMHRHNNTSGVCQENPRAPTHGPQKESLTDPFLTPPEAFVKDQPDLYQPLSA